MFHTFQAIHSSKPSTSSIPEESPKTGPGYDRKFAKGSHACSECRRRKIRCDGKHPCHQCLSCRPVKRCVYDDRRRRVIPSRKTLEHLSQTIEELRSVLTRLFPNHDIFTLFSLSREQLIQLLGSQPDGELNSRLLSTPINADKASTGTLIGFEQMPTRDSEWDEERRGRDPIPQEADDVNALSIPIDRQASYLGVSSIKAVFMAMLKAQPGLHGLLETQQHSLLLGSRMSTASIQATIKPKCNKPVPRTPAGQSLVDQYFQRIHIFTPMVNETAFRGDYEKGQRTEISWLSLLNMVLALGSVFSTKSNNLNHVRYYKEAMRHLSLDSFGSGHIETVQALALLGGYYLHYINRPNMANAILGAALRMAVALGLHRELEVQESNVTYVETRRRTWWSLFCLDTWTTTTMDRPSFGRYGRATNIHTPEIIFTQERDSAQCAGILPLTENIKFCKIATKVQDMLAGSSTINAEYRTVLDDQLLECMTRYIMKWRFQNLRMLLYRPTLLHQAASRVTHLTNKDDNIAVNRCRELANCIIEDISEEWESHQMSGWNAVWLTYQAALIPILSILWQPTSPNVPDWQRQIEKAIAILPKMEEWAVTARRSQAVLLQLYNASRLVLSRCESNIPQTNENQPPGTAYDLSYEPPLEQMDLNETVRFLDEHWLWGPDSTVWGEPSQLFYGSEPFPLSEWSMSPNCPGIRLDEAFAEPWMQTRESSPA